MTPQTRHFHSNVDRFHTETIYSCLAACTSSKSVAQQWDPKWHQHTPILMHVMSKKIIFPHFIHNSLNIYDNIDDIFVIWPQGINTLAAFLENANRTHPNICFTHEHSKAVVSLMDAAIKMEPYPPVNTEEILIIFAISITLTVILPA